MLNLLSNTESYMSFYHTVLSLNGENMHLGRASHVQVFRLPDDWAHPGITHSVRFYDGRYYRELLGAASIELESDTVVLDMGQGKVYRFVKQAARRDVNKTQA
ncbi:hypothetical protein [Desulforhabdus amnigena]|jgi:hypothetical protein|uniref:Uncharacterized protein n=1 Tax=Desulforhabdus amnigena TaxID=40218 RepID=A0A9W6FTT4_9BACT|nr:hypothetical protein [Desulforhabdus amnigena]NLJ26834.1 hypothetical protein [Deltaproteobacteria bacterium]GLI34745.1 hypothetical protein DAMNIGENAA_21780 [Desulforhabdus amnigena]